MASLAAALTLLALTAPIAGPAGRLYVDDGGRGGLPVVFVHSFGGSSGHWAAQLAHLRRGRRAVALDLRGHGRSQAPAPGGYSVDAQAADIGAVVDGLQVPDVPRKVITGTSHWPHMDKPAEFNGILDEFLETVR